MCAYKKDVFQKPWPIRNSQLCALFIRALGNMYVNGNEISSSFLCFNLCPPNNKRSSNALHSFRFLASLIQFVLATITRSFNPTHQLSTSRFCTLLQSWSGCKLMENLRHKTNTSLLMLNKFFSCVLPVSQKNTFRMRHFITPYTSRGIFCYDRKQSNAATLNTTLLAMRSGANEIFLVLNSQIVSCFLFSTQ